MTDGWMTVAETSELLGISPQAIRKTCLKIGYGSSMQRQVPGNGGLQYQISIYSPRIPETARTAWLKSHPDVAAPAPVADSLDSESDAAIYRELSGKAKEYVDRWLAIMTDAEILSGQAFKNYCTAKGVSWQNAYSIKREWLLADRSIKALVPQWGRNAGKSSVSDQDFDAFKVRWLTQARPSVKSVWREILGLASKRPEFKAEGFPSHMAFYRRLTTEMTDEAIYRLRYGDTAYRQRFGYHIMRNYDALLAGQVWVADHAQSDRAVLMPSGAVVFPWYSVFCCAKSQKWLGWCLHDEGPNSDHIFTSFHRAAVVHGIGTDAIIDNGKDFRVRDFSGGRRSCRLEFDESQTKSLLGLLKITPHFARPYNPEAKIIERTFGRFNSSYSRHHAGYRGPNILQKPENLKAQLNSGDIIPWEQFKTEFDRFVIEVFNREPLEGSVHQGRSPDEIWETEYPLAVSRGLVRHVSEAALSFFCTRATDDLTIRGNGIWDSKTKQWYYAEWMVPYVGSKAYLRRDDQWPNVAWICNAETNVIMGQATVDGRAPALAKTDEEQETLRQKIERQSRVNRIAKALARLPENVDTGDFVENRIAAANILNAARGFTPGKEMPKNFVVTDVDLQLEEQKHKDEVGTHKASDLLPFEPVKKPKYDLDDLRSAAAGF